MARSVFAVALVLVGVQSAPAPAQSPVSLAATLRPEAIRLEVAGPPRAAYAVLVSPEARGGYFHGHPVAIEYLHPRENLLGGGKLDDRGRGVVEVPCRRADLARVGVAYLQAVAFESDDPRRVLGVSGALRFRAGPPLAIESWRPSPWRAWMVPLAPLLGLLAGAYGRRRGRDPRRWFAAAAVLVVAVSFRGHFRLSRFVPAFLAEHGLAQERADAAILGEGVAAAVVAVRDHAAGADAIRVRFGRGARPVPPRLLQYHLYPLRLLPAAAEEAEPRREGRVVWLLTDDPEDPPPGAGYRAVHDFRVAGFRLFRAGGKEGA